MAGTEWERKRRLYPGDPSCVQAVPLPTWEDISGELAGVRPSTVRQVVARYRAHQSAAIYGDAVLEGITYTEQEVTALLAGDHVPGHADGEAHQVQDMRRASDFLISRVEEGRPIEPGQAISDDIHVFVSAHLNIPTPMFRGDQSLRYEGPKVGLGAGRKYQALDARLTHDALDAGLDGFLAVEHPLARAATWAAFAAYHQFYFDGNKRTGRYVMNAVLLSHGYDAILVPAVAKEAYENVVVRTLETGDLTEQVRFLVGLYPGVAARTARPTRSDQAEIRAWARSQGYTVSDRGRVPTKLIADYDRAHA